MCAWEVKRFWKEAGVNEVEGGFAVRLDGRAVKTPAKAPASKAAATKTPANGEAAEVAPATRATVRTTRRLWWCRPMAREVSW